MSTETRAPAQGFADDAGLSIRTGIVDVGGTLVEKDTKTHTARSISIDTGTVKPLRGYHKKVLAQAALCGMELAADAFILSEWPCPYGRRRPRSVADLVALTRQPP